MGGMKKGFGGGLTFKRIIRRIFGTVIGSESGEQSIPVLRHNKGAS